MFDNQYHVPRSACPHCGKEMDGATETNGNHGPVPGNAGMCIYCGEVNVYDENMMLRKMTPEETVKFQADPVWITVLRVRKAIARMRASQN